MLGRGFDLPLLPLCRESGCSFRIATEVATYQLRSRLKKMPTLAHNPPFICQTTNAALGHAFTPPPESPLRHRLTLESLEHIMSRDGAHFFFIFTAEQGLGTQCRRVVGVRLRPMLPARRCKQ